MLVPITKTFWRGKVGTPKKCACNVTGPVTSVPVTSIYCSRERRRHVISFKFLTTQSPSVNIRADPEQVQRLDSRQTVAPWLPPTADSLIMTDAPRCWQYATRWHWRWRSLDRLVMPRPRSYLISRRWRWRDALRTGERKFVQPVSKISLDKVLWNAMIGKRNVNQAAWFWQCEKRYCYCIQCNDSGTD